MKSTAKVIDSSWLFHVLKLISTRVTIVVLSQQSNTFCFLSPFSLKEDGAGTPYDKESTAIIKLNNTTVLYLKEVTKFLALVCFVREESFERKGNVLLWFKRRLPMQTAFAAVAPLVPAALGWQPDLGGPRSSAPEPPAGAARIA